MKKNILLIISTLLFLVADSQVRWDPRYFEPVFSVAEFQPQIQWNGRFNTIAINPGNNREIVVASETGGLFKSSNGGVNWVHLDNLPSCNVNDVAFYQGYGGLLFATTWKDMKTNNGGGVWKSTDGGINWTQCVIPATSMGSCRSVFSAYSISIEPGTGKIFVATDCGVAFSNDRGVTWSHTAIIGAGTVVSIVALGENQVIAGGTGGVFYANDGIFGSTSWNRTNSTEIGALAEGNDYGAIHSLHALTRSSHAELVSGTIAFAIDTDNKAYYSSDGGRNWTSIHFPHSGRDGCGGINFIKAIRKGNLTTGDLDLYISNRCNIYKLTCPRIAGTRSFDFSSGPPSSNLWVKLNDGHDDTRDLGFSSSTGQPLFMATDGGLATPPTERHGPWSYIGSGARRGLTALQITEVTGQLIQSPGRRDLYFATQDNDLWYSPNSGRSWNRGARAEGFYFDMLRKAPTQADSKITYVAGSADSKEISDPLFANAASWANAPRGFAHAVLIQKGVYAQLQGRAAPTEDILKRIELGVERDLLELYPITIGITKNSGARWQTIINIPEDIRGRPVVVGSATNPVIYQAIKAGWNSAKRYDSIRLLRASNFLSGTGASAVISNATLAYPAMRNFGGIGVCPTMFAWYEVYAVDPADPSHIIAADVINGAMKYSTNGGNDWLNMPELTRLVTEDGRLKFSRQERICEVSHISYFPDYPQYIMIGTLDAGLFYSQDGGTTWRNVPGSKLIPSITSIHWINESQLVISSYGRGLWKVNIHFRPIPIAVERIRANFFAADITGIKQPEVIDQKANLDNAFMVANGYITDMVVNDKKELTEITVSPGGIFMHLNGKDNKLLSGITISEEQKSGSFKGLETCLAILNQKKTLNGFKLINGRLTEVIYSNTTIDMEFPPIIPGKIATTEPKESPIKGKPSILLFSKKSNANGIFERNDQVQLVGQHFLDDPGKPIEILIDDKVINQNIKAKGGVFSINLNLNLPIGIHNIKARQNSGPNSVLIDNISFIIKHTEAIQYNKTKLNY